MENNTKCPLCGSEAWSDSDSTGIEAYDCPVCGRYALHIDKSKDNMDKNRLAVYLFYHCYSITNPKERRRHTVQIKEICDGYRKIYAADEHAELPVHMDYEMVDAWYPKSISEKMDYILIYLNNHIRHIGQKTFLPYNSLLPLFFIDTHETDANNRAGCEKLEFRDRNDCADELRYMIDCMKEIGYIAFESGDMDSNSVIRITPKGYSRIDELQKNSSNGRNALVAMKFGEDTRNLREAIRKGIQDAGFIAIFIDEVQHNDFITPELLKHIRDSKFVVVDLTHENNGAYFEEGYAMGLGKPVIQLCKKETKLHFDIVQKNTIMWASEDDIPDMLTNRINATID